MVDEPCEVPLSSGIDDRISVSSEEIAAAHPHLLVLHLSQIRHALPHHLPHVLHQHRVCVLFDGYMDKPDITAYR